MGGLLGGDECRRDGRYEQHAFVELHDEVVTADWSGFLRRSNIVSTRDLSSQRQVSGGYNC